MAMSGLNAKGVPPQPAFLRIIKVVIIFLSVVILALAAYAISIFGGYYGYYGSAGVAGLLIFVAIKTWIIFGIALFLETKAQQYFWRIILVIAYIISCIFWLSAWAWAASDAAQWLSAASIIDNSCYYDVNDNYVCVTSSNDPLHKEGAVLAACAGLGAVVWILCIVHLVLFVMACLRDSTGTATQNAELGQVKAQEAYPAQQAYPAQPQPQQPYPQQAEPVHNQGPYEQQQFQQQPYQQPHQQTYPPQ